MHKNEQIVDNIYDCQSPICQPEIQNVLLAIKHVT